MNADQVKSVTKSSACGVSAMVRIRELIIINNQSGSGRTFGISIPTVSCLCIFLLQESFYRTLDCIGATKNSNNTFLFLGVFLLFDSLPYRISLCRRSGPFASILPIVIQAKNVVGVKKWAVLIFKIISAIR